MKKKKKKEMDKGWEAGGGEKFKGVKEERGKEKLGRKARPTFIISPLIPTRITRYVLLLLLLLLLVLLLVLLLTTTTTTAALEHLFEELELGGCEGWEEEEEEDGEVVERGCGEGEGGEKAGDVHRFEER